MTSDLASDPTRWHNPSGNGGEDEQEWTDTFIRQSEWGVGRKGWVSNSVYVLLALFFGGWVRCVVDTRTLPKRLCLGG